MLWTVYLYFLLLGFSIHILARAKIVPKWWSTELGDDARSTAQRGRGHAAQPAATTTRPRPTPRRRKPRGSRLCAEPTALYTAFRGWRRRRRRRRRTAAAALYTRTSGAAHPPSAVGPQGPFTPLCLLCFSPLYSQHHRRPHSPPPSPSFSVGLVPAHTQHIGLVAAPSHSDTLASHFGRSD